MRDRETQDYVNRLRAWTAAGLVFGGMFALMCVLLAPRAHAQSAFDVTLEANIEWEPPTTYVSGEPLPQTLDVDYRVFYSFEGPDGFTGQPQAAVNQGTLSVETVPEADEPTFRLLVPRSVQDGESVTMWVAVTAYFDGDTSRESSFSEVASKTWVIDDQRIPLPPANFRFVSPVTCEAPSQGVTCIDASSQGGLQ